MSQAAFLKGLQSAMPGFTLSVDADGGSVPDGYVPVRFHMQPTRDGVQLRMKLGEAPVRQLTFSDEEEALDFLRSIQRLAASALALERRAKEIRRSAGS